MKTNPTTPAQKCSICKGKRIVSSNTPGIKDGHACFHCGATGIEPNSPSSGQVGREWEKGFDKMLEDYADNVYSAGDPKRTLGTTEVIIKKYIRDLLKSQRQQLLAEIKEKIESVDPPFSFGSASGSVMKKMVLEYLEDLEKGVKPNENRK